MNSFFRLLDGLRATDPVAIQEFSESYGEVIRRELRFYRLDRRLRHVVGDSDLVQSILARLYFELFSGRLTFETPNKLLEFVKVVTRAKITDAARYWTAQRRDMRRNTSLHGDELVDRDSAAMTPSRIMMTAELLPAVMAKLSDRELTILKWRQERVPWNQIARQLEPGLSAEQVRKQHERLLSRLARELELEEGAT